MRVIATVWPAMGLYILLRNFKTQERTFTLKRFLTSVALYIGFNALFAYT